MNDELMRLYDAGDRRAIKAVNALPDAEFKHRWDVYSKAVLRSQRRKGKGQA